MMIDILDRHQDRHQEGKHVVVAENIDIVVDIHHHQLHGLPIQAHRLIVHVRHQVVHIEDIDVDDHVHLVHHHVHHLVQVIIVDVAVVAVHHVRIRDIVHQVHDLLVHPHHHVVHIVDQDHEVIIEKHRDVLIIIIKHNQIITMEKVVVQAQHVGVEELEITHVVVELNQTKCHVVQHPIEIVLNILLSVGNYRIINNREY
jgi:hypothetical protein